MNIFLFIYGAFILFLGVRYFSFSDKFLLENALAILIIASGLFVCVVAIILPDKESLYKLTVTDTVTNKEEVYEFITDIEEHESYIKFTDKDGNEQYLMMEDKEILKEELE